MEEHNCEPPAANTPSSWKDEHLGREGVSGWPTRASLQFTAGTLLALGSYLVLKQLAVFFLQMLLQHVSSFFLEGNTLHLIFNNELFLLSCAFNYWLAHVFFFSCSEQFKGLLFYCCCLFLNLLCLVEDSVFPMCPGHTWHSIKCFQ